MSLLQRLLVGITLATAVACSAARGPATRPHLDALAVQLEADLARFSAKPWSRIARLEWNDFVGPAPSEGSEGALTVYSLFHGLRCTGRSFEFRVIAGFLPSQSWVKPAVLADRDLRQRTLGHEQTHFDLTEVYARRMRKFFATYTNPCVQTEEQLRVAASQFISDEDGAQTRYDADTRHGLNPARQREWDEQVATWLVSLEDFGQTDP